MNNFQRIAQNIDVIPLLLAIKLQPELWDAHGLRRERPLSPHYSAPDIWVRYNAPEKINEPDFTEEHYPIWYPSYQKLPQLRALIFPLMARLEATHLGGVLITKIPPGKSILPHTDRGWHPEFYSTKLYIPLQTNPDCINRVENETAVMKTGECWYFNNTVEHEVINNGSDDRITLIICMRTE
jgi:hypothetical protein